MSADEPHPRRNILILSLQKEPWSDETYTQLHSALRINANVTEVQSPGAAFTALSAMPRPDAILVSDGAITRPERARVLSALVAYARTGSTVVLGMGFANHFPLDAGRPFFAAWGLPPSWDLGSYHRTTFGVNPGGVPAPLDKGAFLPEYSIKALHVKGARMEDAVYLPTAESHTQSLVFAPEPITGELARESPALFVRVGEGHLGHVGDVNGEQGSTRVLLEMCGVKIRPGDMSPRGLLRSVTMHPNGRTEAVRETEEEVPLPVPSHPPPPTRGPRARDEEVRRWNQKLEKDRRLMMEEAEEEMEEVRNCRYLALI